MKKSIIYLLTAVLLLTVLVIPAAAAENGAVHITSASAKVGDTVTLTVSLTGFDKANTLGVAIDAPDGLAFDEENSQWLLSGGVLETLTASKGGWAAEKVRNVNTNILKLIYTVEEFRSDYPVSVTLLVKNNDTVLGEQTVTGTVTVTNPVTELVIRPSALNLSLSDELTEAALTAEVTPEDTTDTLIWSTSDSDVATVKKGLVIARNPGTATITVRGGSCSATCTVTVSCDHSYDDWFTVKEPSAEENGTRRRNCRFCSEYQTEPIVYLAPPEVEITNKASNGAPYLTWTAVDGAVKYEVWRSTSESDDYTRLSTTKNTSLTNSTSEVGTQYYYKLRSVFADGQKSDYSDVVTATRALPAPEITTSNVASSGKILVSWDAVEGAAKYEVHRATSKNGTYSRLITTTKTSVTNTSTTAGTTYYYKVKAIHSNSAANSAYSAVDYRTCDLAQPVLTLSNKASTGKITLSWDAVEGAAKYEVYRATSKNGTYSRLITTTKTSVTNTSTTAGTTYYYKVRAIHSNSAANSAYSAVGNRTCDLARPVLTLSNKASTGKITLSWDAVEGATKYEVRRATSKNGKYSLLKTTTNTSMTNTGTEAGSTYYYKVRAIHSKSAANSADSAMEYRTCDLARPSITVSLNSKKKPVISWKEVDGAVKYEVWRATDPDGKFSRISTTTALKVTNSSAVSGTNYIYKVRAICSNSSGNSAYSTTKSITCP